MSKDPLGEHHLGEKVETLPEAFAHAREKTPWKKEEHSVPSCPPPRRLDDGMFGELEKAWLRLQYGFPVIGHQARILRWAEKMAQARKKTVEPRPDSNAAAITESRDSSTEKKR